MTPTSLTGLIVDTLGQPAPLLLTDGADIYGTAVVGTPVLLGVNHATLSYAALVDGYPGAAVAPVRTYTATALSGAPSRPALSGHLPATNFPDDEHNAMYWYAPLEPTVLASFDLTGDWLFVSLAGYSANPTDGYGPYPSNAQYVLPSLPSPLSAANPSGGISWGIHPGSIGAGGGQFAGVTTPEGNVLGEYVTAGGDQSAIVAAAGVPLPASGICCIVWHKAGGTGHVYVATPGSLMSQMAVTSGITSPPLPGLATPYYVTDREWYGGMQGLGSSANRVTSGILHGTYTPAQIQQVTDALLSGLPVWAPPPIPAAPDLVGPPAGCRGSVPSGFSWSAVDGALGYRVYRSVNGGAYRLAADTAATTWTDMDAALRQTYAYRATAYTRWVEGPSSSVVTVQPCLSAPLLTWTGAPAECAPVTISWGAAEGARGYRIYRIRDYGLDAGAFLPADTTVGGLDPRAGDDGLAAVLIYDGPGTSCVDTEVCCGRRYLYQGYAYEAAGSSDAGAPLEVTPRRQPARAGACTSTWKPKDCS